MVKGNDGHGGRHFAWREFLAGVLAGFLLSLSLFSWGASFGDANVQRGKFVEDPLRYTRLREPFTGPFSVRWLEQFDACMPVEMKHKFTLDGAISVDGVAPSDQVKRWSAQTSGKSNSVQENQVYAPLKKKKHLFGKMTENHEFIWSKELLTYLIDEVASGKDISCADYPQSATDVALAFQLLGVGMHDNILVGGSISPWVEAVVLHVNPGSRVTTVDYNVPLCNDCHPRLQTMHMNVLMQRRTPAGYSHVVSYSSIEHDGLGRYGDPLDPDGDMHAMKEFWSLLRPGGILLLAIPTRQEDRLSQLLARIYGPLRIPLIAHGWEYLGSVNRGKWSEQVPLSPRTDYGFHPIIALRKTQATELPPSISAQCEISCSVESTKVKTPFCGPSSGCRDLSRHWRHLPEHIHLRGQ